MVALPPTMTTNSKMARLLISALATLTFSLAATDALAKPRKTPKQKPDLSARDKDNRDAIRPPGDKGANEGAQGRRNATEDAARAAEGPANDRRP